MDGIEVDLFFFNDSQSRKIKVLTQILIDMTILGKSLSLFVS